MKRESLLCLLGGISLAVATLVTPACKDYAKNAYAHRKEVQEETIRRVERANEISVSEIPKKFNEALCEEGVPRRFVKGLTIKFDPKLGRGETSYSRWTKTISIHPDQRVINWYNLSGVAHQLGSHVLSNVLSKNERKEFEIYFGAYETRASAYFSKHNLMDDSDPDSGWKMGAFVDPLQSINDPTLSRDYFHAEAIGYYFSDPLKECWNNRVHPNNIKEAELGKDLFKIHFSNFFKNSEKESPRVGDMHFNFF